MRPPTGAWPTTKTCALTGNWTGDPLFAGQHSIHWATTARAIYFINITSYMVFSIHMDHCEWLNMLTSWYLFRKHLLMPTLSQDPFLATQQWINRQIDHLSWSFCARGRNYFRMRKECFRYVVWEKQVTFKVKLSSVIQYKKKVE